MVEAHTDLLGSWRYLVSSKKPGEGKYLAHTGVGGEKGIALICNPLAGVGSHPHNAEVGTRLRICEVVRDRNAWEAGRHRQDEVVEGVNMVGHKGDGKVEDWAAHVDMEVNENLSGVEVLKANTSSTYRQVGSVTEDGTFLLQTMSTSSGVSLER